MLVNIYKIGDPHGSYSVYLRFQTQLTVCFQCLEKHITLFTCKKKIFSRSTVSQTTEFVMPKKTERKISVDFS